MQPPAWKAAVLFTCSQHTPSSHQWSVGEVDIDKQFNVVLGTGSTIYNDWKKYPFYIKTEKSISPTKYIEHDIKEKHIFLILLWKAKSILTKIEV